MMKYNKVILFTLNDLMKVGGAALRIRGLASSFSKSSDVILLSNNRNNNIEGIDNVYLNCSFSSFEKKLFQFVITFFPIALVFILFRSKLIELESMLKKLNISTDDELIFCEYLDNSLGYFFKLQGTIVQYTNDHHGIATIEFQQSSSSLISKLKYFVAKVHDEKVLSFSKKHIFASEAMKKYYYVNFHAYRDKEVKILPYYIVNDSYSLKLDKFFIDDFIFKYNLNSEAKKILFVGYFKKLGGVSDLVQAFSRLSKKLTPLELLLVGDGPEYENISNLVNELGLTDSVILPGRIDFKYLASLHSLADVVVCPDRFNSYSNMIVHLKYYHSLLSGLPVVCGSFDSVSEINIDNSLSIDFIPSDVESLSLSISTALSTTKESKERIREFVFQNFSYDSIDVSNRIL